MIVEIPNYVQRFTWDDTKYPRSRSLIYISQSIQDVSFSPHLQKVKSIDADIKQFMAQYNEAKNTLTQLRKKESGSLASRDLGPLVYQKYDDRAFVPADSQFLYNMLVVVPKSKLKDFKANYLQTDEKNQVVPGSLKHLDQLDAGAAGPSDGTTIWRVIVF